MIYLDYNATTPVLPEVKEAILPFLVEEWGNPSSSYRFGSKLKSVLERARESVAELVGARSSREIIFTSGGTESNNAAIHSAILSRPEKRHIITSQVEHSSVLTYCRFLEKHHNYKVTYLPVDREGLISLQDMEDAMSEDTVVVSLMWANNETGVLFPIDEIGARCKKRNVLFHCDGVQVVGKIPLTLKHASIDYLSLTGHKLGAVKGCGALYVQRNASFIPFCHGGHQEKGRRGGTESVPLLVGLGVAAEVARKKVFDYEAKVRPLRDFFEKKVFEAYPDSELNGHHLLRLPNTSNFHFPLVSAEALLLLLDREGIYASSGSACLADSPDPSHVIAAMKVGLASSQSIRFSIGTKTTKDELETTADFLKKGISTLISI